MIIHRFLLDVYFVLPFLSLEHPSLTNQLVSIARCLCPELSHAYRVAVLTLRSIVVTKNWNLESTDGESSGSLCQLHPAKHGVHNSASSLQVMLPFCVSCCPNPSAGHVLHSFIHLCVLEYLELCSKSQSLVL